MKTTTGMYGTIVRVSLALMIGSGLMAAEQAAMGSKEGRPAMLPRTQQLIAEKKPVRVVIYGDSMSSGPRQHWTSCVQF